MKETEHAHMLAAQAASAELVSTADSVVHSAQVQVTVHSLTLMLTVDDSTHAEALVVAQ